MSGSDCRISAIASTLHGSQCVLKLKTVCWTAAEAPELGVFHNILSLPLSIAFGAFAHSESMRSGESARILLNYKE